MTATDLEIIAGLDFDPAVPCGMPPYVHRADVPATIITSPAVHGCADELVAVCVPCWEALGRSGHLHCTTCRACLTRDQALTVVGTIGGPS